jgi:AraC family transcriptional regulator
MAEPPPVDISGYLPSDIATGAAGHWPVAASQRSGAHITHYGLGAFASHSEYPQRTEVTVCDSEHRVHLSVWLRDGVSVNSDGWKFRVEGRDTVAGFLPGAPWKTDFCGHAHHVGLLLRPELLRSLGGDQGEVFFERLHRDGFLRVCPAQADVLRTAHELDAILLSTDSSPLLREAKSLELLARLVAAGATGAAGDDPSGLTRRERNQLACAREMLLADLAQAPTIEQLARASGLNTFRLKQGFKKLFGLSVHALYQQERMRAAWELISSGRMGVTAAGEHLGYTNMSHFGIAFRKAHGMLPSALKRRAVVAR